MDSWTDEEKLARFRGMLDDLHTGLLTRLRNAEVEAAGSAGARASLESELAVVKSDRDSLRGKYLGLLDQLKRLAEGSATEPPPAPLT